MNVVGSRSEHYRAIFKLGFPILIGQLGMIVMGFADTMMLGQYSTDALASASFVNNVLGLPIFALIGFSNGVTPIVAALYSRGSHRELCVNLRSMLLLNVAMGLLLSLCAFVLYLNLHHLGQPEDIVPLIKEYFLINMFGVPIVAITNVMRQFFDGLGSVKVSMWLLLAGNALNIIFNYLLIFGKCGFPEMGLTGAAISTLGSRVAVMIGFAVIMLLRNPYAELVSMAWRSRVTSQSIRLVWNTSLPLALQSAFEFGFFSFCGVMMGWLGKVDMAAYQILIMVSQLGYTIYLSCGAGTSIRISQCVGRGNINQVASAAMAGYHLMLLLAVMASATFVLFAHPIIACFTDDTAVVMATTSLIAPLVLYQFADASQVLFCNALRGIAHVKPLMYIAIVAYVLVNVPVAYIFGFVCGWGAKGIIYSFSVGLILAAVLYATSFYRRVRSGNITL